MRESFSGLLASLLAAALVVPAARPAASAPATTVKVVATEPVPALAIPPTFPWAAEAFVAWSPDGKRVALGGTGDTGYFGLGSSFYALHLVDVSNRRSIWGRAAGGGVFVTNDRFLFWGSDNGGELGLVSLSEGKTLWTYPPEEEPELRRELWGIEGSWNARSGEVALSGGLETSRTSIRALRLSDLRLRRITRPGADPHWSPDGKRLLFTVPKDFDRLDGRAGIVRADGTGRRLFGQGQGLAWLPGGHSVLIARRTQVKADGYELFRVDIDRPRWRFLTSVAWEGGSDGIPSPTWLSPSGRWLAYGRKGRVHLVRTSDGARVQLPLQSGLIVFWGLDDTTLYTRTVRGWLRSQLRFSDAINRTLRATASMGPDAGGRQVSHKDLTPGFAHPSPTQREGLTTGVECGLAGEPPRPHTVTLRG